MEHVTHRQTVQFIPPPLPPKTRPKQNVSSGSTTLTSITSGDSYPQDRSLEADDHSTRRPADDKASSMHPPALESPSSTATVYVAAERRAETSASAPHADATGDTPSRNHVVTIRINTNTQTADGKPKIPSISSVQLKDTTALQNVTPARADETTKRTSGFVRINVGTENDADAKIDLEGALRKETTIAVDKSGPYVYCNTYPISSVASMVMSSGQCSPSDTLDSGTCSDLDGTPPPLPKKKLTKTHGSSQKKSVSVTLITSNALDNVSLNGEIDSEDNDSNISCDSLNSSELNGSSHHEDGSCGQHLKHDDFLESAPVTTSLTFINSNGSSNSLLPKGLLQDIRDRTVRLNNVGDDFDANDRNGHFTNDDQNLNVNAKVNLIQESDTLRSYQLVSQINNQNKTRTAIDNNLVSPPANFEKTANITKTPIISEITYEERQQQEKMKQESRNYSADFIYDTDKYYTFHLNEKVFETEGDKCNDSLNSVNESLKSGKNNGAVIDENSMEYFAGYKDFKSEEVPSTIRSAKGTIRGVKNRVRAGIATFLQIQNTTKSYKEKDAGKVVIYTTTMGIVRNTYQRCLQVKKILRNLLVKFEERDVFMSIEYQDEIRDRMKSNDILVPQLFVDGQYIGDAEIIEKLNEVGELRKMLKPYKSADACNTCQVCGGYRLLPCPICCGSKKSLHRNHFTAEFVALKCMNCDEVGLVKCESCS